MSHLKVKFGDSGHENSDVLICLTHFGFVFSVLGLVVGNVTSWLKFHSFDCLFIVTRPLQQQRVVVFGLLKLLFVVITHRSQFLLSDFLYSVWIILFIICLGADCICVLVFFIASNDNLIATLSHLYQLRILLVNFFLVDFKLILSAHVVQLLLTQLLLQLFGLSKVIHLLLLQLLHSILKTLVLLQKSLFFLSCSLLNSVQLFGTALLSLFYLKIMLTFSFLFRLLEKWMLMFNHSVVFF